MTIKFTCNHCGSAVDALDEMAQRLMACPGCEAPILVPGLSKSPTPLSSPVPIATDPPTALALAALISVFWLTFAATLVQPPRFPETMFFMAKYAAKAEARKKLDRELAPLGINSNQFYGVTFLLSGVVSFGLVVASLSRWRNHNLVGKILTLTAILLLILCPLIGFRLGPGLYVLG